MKFIETNLKGAFIIEPDRIEDGRGFFARVFCEQEYAAHGLETHFVQCGVSFNRLKGTLRGLHCQAAPHEEVKIVRCTSGAVYDVIVDLRSNSATNSKWLSVELSAENRRMLYVPKGFAHGFQALADNSELFYQISAMYNPLSARVEQWDNPDFGIDWPLPPTAMSQRDRTQ